MTAEELKALDEKRREREDELLILLLLLLGDATKLIDGETEGLARFDPEAARAFLAGLKSPSPDGIVSRLLLTIGKEDIAESMAEAHLDAFALFGDVAPDLEALAKQYAPAAGEMADAMVDAIARAGGNTLADSLLLAKYSRSDSTNIEIGAERQIVSASNTGLIDGAFRRTSGPKLAGFRHVSVLDERTTKICEGRSGLQLPAASPYWLLNWPSLHARCRSTIVPIFGPFSPSEPRDLVPPDVGYGRMPAYMQRMIRKLAA